MYRGVAFEILKKNIDWENDAALKNFLKDIDLNFVMKKGIFVLMSSGIDITNYIRTPEISMLASSSSAKPQIRAALLDIQRNIGRTNDAIFEGRDMGTMVFPDAEYKFFLFADLNVRAKRRFDEMQNSEKQDNINKVKKDMQTRDNKDSQRKTAPLVPAKDAVKIDSSFLTIEQVVEKMLEYIDNT